MAGKLKARNIAAIGLTSILIGACGSGFGGGSQPDYREEEAAAIVEATMRAYDESTQSQSCTSPSRIDPSVVESADYFLARTVDTLEIRSGPDVHSADNIIGRIPRGEEVIVVSGPECDGGLMLWEVMARESGGLRGWTPEIRGEVAREPLWLLSPIGEVAVGMSAGGAYGFPDEYGNWISLSEEDAQLYVEEVSSISTRAVSGEIGESEARRELVGIAGEIGADSLAWVMRRVPIYRVETGQWQSTDSYLKEEAARSGIDPDSRLAQDPIAVGIDLMFGYSIFETEDTPCSINNDDYFVCVAEMWGMDRDWFIIP